MITFIWLMCSVISFVWMHAEHDKQNEKHNESVSVLDNDDLWYMVIIVLLGPIGLVILSVHYSETKKH